MLKYIAGLIILILFALSGWYFFLKKEDYKINLSLKYNTENLYLAARQGDFRNLELQANIKEDPFQQLTQRYTTAEGQVILKWYFSVQGEETSQARLKVTHLENNFLKRFKLIFYTPDFQKTVLEGLKDFREKLELQEQVFRINIEGIKTIPESYCACLALTGKKEEKAFEMMKHINLLSNFVATYELETAGRPRVLITDFNKQSGKINFDFCFPLKEDQEIPEHNLIFTRKISSGPAVKAIFNGNYMNSHLAWPYLVNFAESQTLEIEYLPLEVYNSNPELGGDALNWEAEIYIPVKN